MRKSKIYLYSLIVILLVHSNIQESSAQKSRSQLEKEKKENLKAIEESEKILSQTEEKKQTSLGQLRALNQQIKARGNLINSLTEEIAYLETDVRDLNIVTNALEKDLENLKQEYAEMIYSSYKSDWGVSKLSFLFSSTSFNQLSRRIKYLEQYAEARQMQAQEIEIVSTELKRQRDEVTAKKSEQDKLLKEQIAENRKLLRLKGKQSGLITELSKKEKQLKKELNERKASIAKLDNLIAELIRIEASKKNSLNADVDIKELNRVFEKNKLKIPWPVDQGFISMKFGKHPHPVLKGEYEENKGVIIQTSKNEKVKAVFSGKVTVVRKGIPVYKNMLLIKHGNYFTLYAYLNKVNVEEGQTVNVQDIIGEVHTNKEGVSQLHFQVWKDTTYLNPEKWLKKR